jgi:hypothetical protein
VGAAENRKRRAQILRYEFVYPDVAYSIDFKRVPADMPGARKRYLFRIVDECTRLTLKRALTDHKGAGVGLRFVREHFREGRIPLVFKYDREFNVPDFERWLLYHNVVPLPSPRRRPQFNGKFERTNKDVQLWLGAFEGDQFWSYEEIDKELQFCFEQLDEIEERAMFGGRTRRQAYEQMARSRVDRDEFFRDACAFRRRIMQRPNPRLDSADIWRLATKEVLKKYDLVRYSRP